MTVARAPGQPAGSGTTITGLVSTGPVSIAPGAPLVAVRVRSGSTVRRTVYSLRRGVRSSYRSRIRIARIPRRLCGRFVLVRILLLRSTARGLVTHRIVSWALRTDNRGADEEMRRIEGAKTFIYGMGTVFDVWVCNNGRDT